MKHRSQLPNSSEIEGKPSKDTSNQHREPSRPATANQNKQSWKESKQEKLQPKPTAREGSQRRQAASRLSPLQCLITIRSYRGLQGVVQAILGRLWSESRGQDVVAVATRTRNADDADENPNKARQRRMDEQERQGQEGRGATRRNFQEAIRMQIEEQHKGSKRRKQSNSPRAQFKEHSNAKGNVIGDQGDLVDPKNISRSQSGQCRIHQGELQSIANIVNAKRIPATSSGSETHSQSTNERAMKFRAS